MESATTPFILPQALSVFLSDPFHTSLILSPIFPKISLAPFLRSDHVSLKFFDILPHFSDVHFFTSSHFSPTHFATFFAAFLISSQCVTINATPAATPPISKPVGEKTTEPMLDSIGPALATIPVAPETIFPKQPDPNNVCTPLATFGNTSFKIPVPRDAKDFKPPDTKFKAAPFRSTIENTDFKPLIPANNAKNTVPELELKRLVITPLNASHIALPTLEIIPHQSIFERNVPILFPICPQSIPCSAVSSVSRIPNAASLSVIPKSAQFILLKKAFILLAMVSPSFVQLIFSTNVCTELIAPLKPFPRDSVNFGKSTLYTRPITPSARALPIAGQSAVVTNPYRASICACKNDPIVCPSLSQSTLYTRPLSP